MLDTPFSFIAAITGFASSNAVCYSSQKEVFFILKETISGIDCVIKDTTKITQAVHFLY
jgi:hypothetical protein